MTSQNPPLIDLEKINSKFESKLFLDAKIESQELLKKFPRSDILLGVLGINLVKMGDFEDAREKFLLALKINPTKPEYFYQLGVVEASLSNLKSAIQNFRRAIDLGLKSYNCYLKLARCLDKTGASEAALEYIKAAILIAPDKADVFNQLGIIYLSLEEWRPAKASFEKAIKLDKANSSIPLSNLALVMAMLKEPETAIALAEEAISIDSSDAWAYNNLGNMYNQLGQSLKAIKIFQKALAHDPTFAEAHNHIGGTYLNLGRHSDALDAYEAAISIDPHFADAHNNRNLSSNYSTLYTPMQTFEKHLAFGKIFDNPKALNKKKKNNTSILRVGYVSGDFRKHSVSYFFEPILEHHSSGRVRTICYYNAKKQDVVTKRLQQLSDEWRQIEALDDETFAQLVADDEIDILVDLSGHTRGNRLTAFARRLAPIQLTWLGYPNTSGLTTMDYRLTDEVTDPTDQTDQFFTEQLIRLKHGFLCYRGDSRINHSSTPPSSSCDEIIFGSFNNSNKITDQVIAVWSQILKSVPKSKLMLKSNHFDSPDLKKSLTQKFKEQGISAKRIILLNRIEQSDHHLKLYDSVDIALDPFPYNGTTTTCESLWMGVPVITLAGETHAGRVSSSILKRVGLDELVSSKEETYIKLAVKLAGNLETLILLKSSLRKKMLTSPLCDEKLFTQILEDTYASIWAQYCRDQT